MLPPYCPKEWDTNLEEFFLFFKYLSKICLAAFLPTPRLSASCLVVIHLSCFSIARVFSTFSLDRGESGRPGRVSFSSDVLPFEKARTILRLVHDSVTRHRTHFSGLDTFRGSFPRFKVKFNHDTLLHAETFDKRNKYMLTSTAIKQLMAPESRVCAR
jgi:hypothetical protein